MSYPQSIQKVIDINSDRSTVWQFLVDERLIQKWMHEEAIEIITTWQPDSNIVIRGQLHGMAFKNSGQILQYIPEWILEYTHLSSLSKLPYEHVNYSKIKFELTSGDGHTNLKLSLCNFPTESIYKHLDFYWSGTLGLLKDTIEHASRLV